MKPLLKWPGGKSKIAPLISKAFGEPCRGVYYEPFIGAGSVFLHRQAQGEIKNAILSDVNPRLIAFHRLVRDRPTSVIKELSALPLYDWKEHYYNVRSAYNASIDLCDPQHAARLLWLNHACFNGLYRENHKGEFNVPMGSYAKLALPSTDEILAVSRLLAGVSMKTASYEEVMSGAQDGDQVYCDPPYVPLSTTASFTAYAGKRFTFESQERLAGLAEELARKGAKVVLSNHDLPIVREELYPESRGFIYEATLQVGRSISCKGGRRDAANEVIVSIGSAK